MIAAFAASIAGPPFMYSAQPSSEAVTKRCTTSFFSSTIFARC